MNVASHPLYKRIASFSVLFFVFIFMLVPANAENDYLYVSIGESNPYIGELKSILYEFGYYYVADSSVLSSNTLDDPTIAALQRCCDTNNLESNENGLMYSAWSVIRTKDIQNLNEDENTVTEEYITVHYMESSDIIGRMQQVLKDLNYDYPYAPNVFDDTFASAIRTFLSINNLDPELNSDLDITNGITPYLQKLILENDESLFVPFPDSSTTPEPVPELGTMEKLRVYFTGQTVLFNYPVPTIVLWLVSLGLLIACIGAVIYFFVPIGDNHRQNDEFKKAKSPKKGNIRFEITYEDKTEVFNRSIEKVLMIGRNVGSFPLSMDDQKISRRHCEIFYQGAHLMLRDYSANGTIVNGKFIHNSQCLLHNGDLILIGAHSIKIIF